MLYRTSRDNRFARRPRRSGVPCHPRQPQVSHSSPAARPPKDAPRPATRRPADNRLQGQPTNGEGGLLGSEDGRTLAGDQVGWGLSFCRAGRHADWVLGACTTGQGAAPAIRHGEFPTRTHACAIACAAIAQLASRRHAIATRNAGASSQLPAPARFTLPMMLLPLLAIFHTSTREYVRTPRSRSPLPTPQTPDRARG